MLRRVSHAVNIDKTMPMEPLVRCSIKFFVYSGKTLVKLDSLLELDENELHD